MIELGVIGLGMILTRSLIVALVFAPALTLAQTDRVVESPALWRQREESRIASQRRDCEAQWAGMEKAGKAGSASRDAFVEGCLAETRIARCHPPGNNPTCRYLRREERKARESGLPN